MKGTKARTYLVLDGILFALMLVLSASALLMHAGTRSQEHMRWMFHQLHGVAGLALCAVLGAHLVLHWPWISSQLSRLKRPGPSPQAGPDADGTHAHA